MVAPAAPLATAPARRIHIIGGPGSGKTWLARELHRATGLPHHELDRIAGDGEPPKFLPPRPVEQRRAALHEIAVTPAWITEGSSALWTGELLAAADCIIWLDVGRRAAIPRIIRRHFAAYVSAIRSSPGIRGRLRAARYPHLAALGHFLRYTWAYYAPGTLGRAPGNEEECSRASAAYVLAPLAAKTLRFGHTPAIDAIISRLNPPERPIGALHELVR